MAQLLRGMLVALCIVASVFFARFYRKSRDRFFALFAVAFGMLGLNWVGAAVLETHAQPEARQWVFLVRLLAFVVILVAIADKNRTRGSA